MPDAPPRAAQGPPPIPTTTVQEGARWRHHRPSSEQVAAWFRTQPLDDGMAHASYVGGVVIIPGTEKVKHSTEKGLVERYEQTFVPYMQIGTRVAYARHLAERRDLRLRIGAMEVPRSLNPQSVYFNGNMPEGLWWHVVKGDHAEVRYLCATAVVQFFEPQAYTAKLRGESPMPVLEGSGTKQVSGGADPNGIMKAQTGAIGRALGVAGMLVVGTGIATAEDMQEYVAQPMGAPQLPPSEIAPGEPPPPAEDPAARLSQLQSRAIALQAQMQEDAPESWREFAAWWGERAKAEGWKTIGEVPLAALAGIVQRMEMMYEAASNAETGVPA